MSSTAAILTTVPSCFSISVKSILIKDFVGNRKGLRAVRLLLSNALELNKMDIIFSEDHSRNLQKVEESY